SRRLSSSAVESEPRSTKTMKASSSAVITPRTMVVRLSVMARASLPAVPPHGDAEEHERERDEHRHAEHEHPDVVRRDDDGALPIGARLDRDEGLALREPADDRGREGAV